MTMKSERYLTFFLDSYLCALKVTDVREINRPSEADTEAHALVRDESITTFSIRQRLGLDAKSLTPATRLIVVKNRDKKTATLVDSIHGVVDLYADQWESPSASDALPFPNHSIFCGVATWKGHSILLLDISRATASSDSQDIAV